MSSLSIKNEGKLTLVCKEYTLPRRNPNSELVCALKDNVRISPVSDTNAPNVAGQHSTDVLIPPKQNLQDCSWVLISRGINRYASQILDLGEVRC